MPPTKKRPAPKAEAAEARRVRWRVILERTRQGQYELNAAIYGPKAATEMRAARLAELNVAPGKKTRKPRQVDAAKTAALTRFRGEQGSNELVIEAGILVELGAVDEVADDD